MDPNLIMRILQMARARQAGGQGQPFSVGQSSAPTGGMMPPGMYGGGGGLQGRPMPPGLGNAGSAPQGQGMAPGVGSAGFAPPGQGPSPSLYGSAPGGLTGANMPMSQMFQPPSPQAEMALSQAGGQQMNPMIAQIMRHLGMLNMLRNRSAQPFMAGQDQGY